MRQAPVISYGYNREDLVLEGYFADSKEGIYVDIGAGHPVKGSATKRLYQRGWHGINVESSKKLLPLLAFDRPRDVAVATAPSLATLCADQKLDHINLLKVSKKDELLEVLKSNDWQKYRPELLCLRVESAGKSPESFLATKKYTRIFYDGLHEYYAAQEAAQQFSSFSYAKQVLQGGRTLTLTLKERFDLLAQDDAIAKLHEQYLLRRAIGAEKKLHYYLGPSLIWSTKNFLKALNGFMVKRLQRPGFYEPVFAAQAEAHLDALTRQQVRALTDSYAASVTSVYHGPSALGKVVRPVIWFCYRLVRKTIKIILSPLRRKLRQRKNQEETAA